MQIFLSKQISDFYHLPFAIVGTMHLVIANLLILMHFPPPYTHMVHGNKKLFDTINVMIFVCFLKEALKVIRPRGYKTFFMLNSIEHEIFSDHKC